MGAVDKQTCWPRLYSWRLWPSAPIMLSSTGGLSTEWPIFLHTWVLDSEYDNMPTYRCDECFGSRKKLIWMENRWSIVDCTPAEGCPVNAVYLMSPEVTKGVCIWDVQGTWRYCNGAITVEGCVSSDTDDTVNFECV